MSEFVVSAMSADDSAPPGDLAPPGPRSLAAAVMIKFRAVYLRDRHLQDEVSI